MRRQDRHKLNVETQHQKPILTDVRKVWVDCSAARNKTGKHAVSVGYAGNLLVHLHSDCLEGDELDSVERLGASMCKRGVRYVLESMGVKVRGPFECGPVLSNALHHQQSTMAAHKRRQERLAERATIIPDLYARIVAQDPVPARRRNALVRRGMSPMFADLLRFSYGDGHEMVEMKFSYVDAPIAKVLAIRRAGSKRWAIQEQHWQEIWDTHCHYFMQHRHCFACNKTYYPRSGNNHARLLTHRAAVAATIRNVVKTLNTMGKNFTHVEPYPLP